MSYNPDHIERQVSIFYERVGWKACRGITEDARRFEDLRKCANKYVSRCRLRVLRHMPLTGENLLDMGSGPVQYEEYLQYSKGFKQRYCVDLSLKALEAAKGKIGEHGVFLHGSFFDMDLEDNFFDCSISLHVIYHIDKDRQEEAVRKLLRVTKPGKPVIIVYSNPTTFTLYVDKVIRRLKTFHGCIGKPIPKSVDSSEPPLYYFAHTLRWWKRFSDTAEIKILPWRSFGTYHQKRYVPDNRIGSNLLDILFFLEETFPKFFVEHFQFPMIILTKLNTAVE